MRIQATLCLVIILVSSALSFIVSLKSRRWLRTLSTTLNNNNLNNPYKDIDNIRTPFLSELIKISGSIPLNNRFFFPGHVGGRNFPLSKLLENHPCDAKADDINQIHTHDLNLMMQLDLPELESIDTVHCPETVLNESLELAAELFGAKRTWFLVNGSTSGVLAAVLAIVKLHRRRRHLKTTSSNSKTSANAKNSVTEGSIMTVSKLHINTKRQVLILGRDSHKSAVDALSLADCDAVVLPCIIEPTFNIPIGSFVYENIEAALMTYGEDVCGVLLTRPSYQGVACDSASLQRIATLCHTHCVPLIIDEAHGSHLRFIDFESNGTDNRLQDGMSSGADIVIQSTHKTLTSLSQTGMMHFGHDAFSWVNKGDDSNKSHPTSTTNVADQVINTQSSPSQAPSSSQYHQIEAMEMLQQCYSMLTTTSANALLLASLDTTRAQMSSNQGRDMIQTAVIVAQNLRSFCRSSGSSGNNCDSSTVDDCDNCGGNDGDASNKADSNSRKSSNSSDSDTNDMINNQILTATSPLKLLDDSLLLQSLQFVVDPLRLTIHFEGESAVEVDEQMCEEDGIYCELNLDDCVTYALPIDCTIDTLSSLKHSLEKVKSRLMVSQKLNSETSNYYSNNNNDNINDTSDSTSSNNTTTNNNINNTATTITTSNSKNNSISDSNNKPVLLGYIMSERANGLDCLQPRLVPLEDTVGTVSVETICPYPPGIPLLVKGEIITSTHITEIQLQRKTRLGKGRTVTGCSDGSLEFLSVIVRL